MNFAGYELAKNALSKDDNISLEAPDLQPDGDEMSDQKNIFALQNIDSKSVQPESSTLLDDVTKDLEPVDFGSSQTSHSQAATSVTTTVDVSPADNETPSAAKEEIQQSRNPEQASVSGQSTVGSGNNTSSGMQKTESASGYDAVRSDATTEKTHSNGETNAQPEKSGNLKKVSETKKTQSQDSIDVGDPPNNPSKRDS